MYQHSPQNHLPTDSLRGSVLRHCTLKSALSFILLYLLLFNLLLYLFDAARFAAFLMVFKMKESPTGYTYEAPTGLVNFFGAVDSRDGDVVHTFSLGNNRDYTTIQAHLRDNIPYQFVIQLASAGTTNYFVLVDSDMNQRYDWLSWKSTPLDDNATASYFDLNLDNTFDMKEVAIDGKLTQSIRTSTGWLDCTCEEIEDKCDCEGRTFHFIDLNWTEIPAP